MSRRTRTNPAFAPTPRVDRKAGGTTARGRPEVSVPATRWGLAAFAEVGSVRVEVDEGIDREAYAITLNVRPVCVRFPIRGRSVPADVARFLTAGGAGAAELALAAGADCSATLVRDRESADRFFVRFDRGEATVVLTLADQPLRDLTAAVSDAAGQLAG